MDRLAQIVGWQWRAHWRRFKRGRNLAIGHQGLTLIIAFLLLYKYVRLLGTASTELTSGNTKLLQSLLAGLFLAWLFLPLSMSRSDVVVRRLLHMPFSVDDLLAIRIGCLLITPYSWIVIAASVAIFYPLVHAPRPISAITAALLFISMSGMIGLTVSHVLRISAWRKGIFATFLLLCVAAYFLSGKDSFQFAQLSRLLPINLLAGPAVGENSILAISALLVLNMLSVVAVRSSFRQSLVNVRNARSSRRLDSLLFRLPGAASSLAAKDFRYFRRLLDPYLGVLASALCCVYLVTANAPIEPIAWLFIIFVFIPNSPLAFNCFGLDKRAGLDRYALLPVSGATIIRSKNLAFLIFTAIQIFPIIVLTSWRLGLLAGALSVVEATSVAAIYLSWGNWMSISYPARMEFFRFAPAGGSLPEIIAAVFFCSLPGIIIIYVLQTGAEWRIPAALLVSLVSVTLYFVATNISGKRFEAKREKVVGAIS